MADIKQVWGKYQEKDRLKTSVEGMSAEDIGRAQEMLEQDALQQMQKPQLIFENDIHAKSEASQIISVSSQIPEQVAVGQNIRMDAQNGTNAQQLTNELQDDIKEYKGLPSSAESTSISFKYSKKKIGKQIAKRGWSDDTIYDAINNPVKTKKTRDQRWLPHADAPRDDPATAYFAADGSYVVRNDKTGEIVQISDKNDKEWIVPWED